MDAIFSSANFLGTAILTTFTVSLTFWLKSKNICDNALYVVDFKNVKGYVEYAARDDDNYYLKNIRAIEFDVLDFGTIGITLLARFAYNPSLHPRVFFGSKYY